VGTDVLDHDCFPQVSSGAAGARLGTDGLTIDPGDQRRRQVRRGPVVHGAVLPIQQQDGTEQSLRLALDQQDNLLQHLG
jgi:hypothetical protein